MTGKVFLVGAGCGPADLITLRGRTCLMQADVVVYDDLADPDLLELARPDAEQRYVGKRQGKHSMPQEEICALLIQLAGEGKTVCRLKGGDPFVFGRGGEEALALNEAGIPWEEVPGISSSVAIPARAGIPVTHRDLSRSFHVVTAHTARTLDGLPEGLKKLAGVEGTLVFLMGLSQLKKLAEFLLAEGMSPDTPAAVVGEQTARGSLADIAEKAAGIHPPAVIVVGGTAGMDLTAAAPLHGTTVGLTGTAQFRQKLQPLLEHAGAQVFSLQRSSVQALSPGAELGAGLDWAGEAAPGWAAFTSPNGVEVFFRLLAEGHYDLRRLAPIRFAAVGPGTAAALAAHGIYAELVPEQHDTPGLGQALARHCGGSRVLLLHADNASPAPARALTEAQIPFRRIPLYTLHAGPVSQRLCDYIIFGSASGVENYRRAGGLQPRCAAVCIGAHTAARAGQWCARTVTAADASPDAVVEALLKDGGEETR